MAFEIAQADNLSGEADFSLPSTPSLLGTDQDQKRQKILTYFYAAYDLYDSLFNLLVNEDSFALRGNSMRQPMIFYYGHTAVFYINKLILGGFIEARINPDFENLMAVGVNEMDWDDLKNDQFQWPSIAEVKDYRQKVRAFVEDFITTCDFDLPITPDSPMWAILMGIEHDFIHVETCSVLLRELPVEALRAHSFWNTLCQQHGPAPQNSLIDIEGQTIKLGRPQESETYGWDNEYGALDVAVPDFQASQYLVSNGEYLEFVEDDGYAHQGYWSEEGWQWRQKSAATHPRFWVQNGKSFQYRSLLAEIEMPWDWPVDVNGHEAAAFCAWKSKMLDQNIRLPSETEWALMHEGQNTQSHTAFRNGASSCPVNTHQAANGLYGVSGNVWQWTSSHFQPLDNHFKPHKLYKEYSKPYFGDEFDILKGGSWISCGTYSSSHTRNYFRRHFFQHAGFRYVI